MLKRLFLAAAIIIAAVQTADAQSGSYVSAPVVVSRDKVRKDGRLFYSHVVREKQTLYSISRAYGVSTKDIIEANKDLNLEKNSIRPDDILLIPYVEKVVVVVDEQKPQTQEKKEEAAKAEEPMAPETKSSFFNNLFRPSKASSTEQLSEPKKEEPRDSVTHTAQPVRDSVVSRPSIFEKIEQTVETLFHKEDTLAAEEFIYDLPDTICMTMLLPLNASQKPNARYYSFYMGALLAARDLGMNGVNISISTFDTSLSSNKKDIEESLQKADIILGPVSQADIEATLPILPEGKFIISPMDTKTESQTISSRVILAATPASAQISDAIAWANQCLDPADTLIMVSEKGKGRNATTSQIYAEIDSLHLENRLGVEYNITKGLEMDEWWGQHTHLKDSASIVYAVTDSDPFMKEVIRGVNVQNYLGKNVTLFGTAKSRVMETEDLCNAHLHASTSYHIDYKDIDVQKFVMAYRALFKTDPDSFAFHGYDTAHYFLGICDKYGRGWAKKLSSYEEYGLQTDFKFEESEREGYVNSAIRRVVYSPEFTVEILR